MLTNIKGCKECVYQVTSAAMAPPRGHQFPLVFSLFSGSNFDEFKASKSHFCWRTHLISALSLLHVLKVKHLEDENKKLVTKLKILKEHEKYGSKIDDILKHLENELEEQVENLIQDQEKLKDELLKMQEEVEDTKKK